MSIFFKSKSIIEDFLANICNMWNNSHNRNDESIEKTKTSSKPFFKTVKDYNMELERIEKTKNEKNKNKVKKIKEKKETIEKIEKIIQINKMQKINTFYVNNNIISLEEKIKEKNNENLEKINNIASLIDTVINISTQLEKETNEMSKDCNKQYSASL